jgi:hypothetical protein
LRRRKIADMMNPRCPAGVRFGASRAAFIRSFQAAIVRIDGESFDGVLFTKEFSRSWPPDHQQGLSGGSRLPANLVPGI